MTRGSCHKHLRALHQKQQPNVLVFANDMFFRATCTCEPFCSNEQQGLSQGGDIVEQWCVNFSNGVSDPLNNSSTPKTPKKAV